MSYESANAEILNLFRAAGKEIPHEDSNLGRAVQILQTICDAQNHTIPNYPEQDLHEDFEDDTSFIFEALEELETKIHEGDDDFYFEFDGNEYRIIKESEIWGIYFDEIKNTVEDCYSNVINLDKIPSFIAVSIDWEQTAKNAYVDGYGHTFSSYDGSEEEAAGYYIFRTN
jgi:hypothetical protein